MEASLGTTNVLLGIMAAVSLLEALVLIGAGIAGWVAYKRVMDLVNRIEQQQVAPLALRIHAILDDVKGVTETVKDQTERFDHAVSTTIDRVENTADRMRSSVRAKTSPIVGAIRGLRVVIEQILRSRRQPPADAANVV